MLMNVVFFRAIQKLFNMKSCFLCPVSEAVTQCPDCQELAYCPAHGLYHRGRKKRFTVRYISLDFPQSKEVTRGPPESVQNFRL
jgi:hypothetical protein